MRRCKFNIPEYIQVKDENGRYSHTDKVDHWEVGNFHEWGIDFCEFETGPGNFSVGIVETDDGKIHKPSPEDIVFTDKPQVNDETLHG